MTTTMRSSQWDLAVSLDQLGVRVFSASRMVLVPLCLTHVVDVFLQNAGRVSKLLWR